MGMLTQRSTPARPIETLTRTPLAGRGGGARIDGLPPCPEDPGGSTLPGVVENITARDMKERDRLIASGTDSLTDPGVVAAIMYPSAENMIAWVEESARYFSMAPDERDRRPCMTVHRRPSPHPPENVGEGRAVGADARYQTKHGLPQLTGDLSPHRERPATRLVYCWYDGRGSSFHGPDPPVACPPQGWDSVSPPLPRILTVDEIGAHTDGEHPQLY